jgi:hypothetical protein
VIGWQDCLYDGNLGGVGGVGHGGGGDMIMMTVVAYIHRGSERVAVFAAQIPVSQEF